MNRTSFSYSIEPWVTTNESVEYTTKIFKVLKRGMKIESEDHYAEFSILEAPDWINIVALTPERDIVLVEQYRYGIEEPTLELPGGVSDPGETPFESSKRELMEETGYSSEEWISLGKVSSNPAMLTNYTHTYLALNCIKTAEQDLDGNERINVHVLPLNDFLELVRSGEVSHSLVVAALAKFMLSKYAGLS
ncbi:MAG TPA: NUDIX domain-containing protein [Balneolaceae bacterium]|nr:NUDIX domain-containing protein [Balneolaceae bacterium]|tara:strand:- start:37033 stop:37608 length:576 start_codon:yes stop_codon:yes gene_type:complete